MKTVDCHFEYQDDRFPLGSECACRLRVFHIVDDIHLVLATELSPSPGASVTNTAERWAAEACRRYGLIPEKCVFVEHYDYRPERDVFDFVTFTWFGERAEFPKWRYGTRAEVERMTGIAIE